MGKHKRILQNKFFTLMKYFGKRKHAELFMDGKIHMKHLGYFWDILNCYAEQYDLHEGVVLATDQFKFDGILGELLIGDPMFRAEGYKYCNVACFYRVDVDIFPAQSQYILAHWQEYANMKEFGNFVVIIKDAEELMRRIDVAMRKNNFMYCAGDVNYYKDIEPNIHGIVLNSEPSFNIKNMPKGQKLDSFDKTYRYKNQNEWRISLYRGLKEEDKYDLKVGDLSDIAVLTEIQNMPDKFSRLLTRQEIRPNWDYGYRGNVSRDELRELFLALGDNKAELSLTFGRDVFLKNLDKMPPLQKGDFLERLKKKGEDALNDLVSGVKTQEEFSAEIKRLNDILEKQRIPLPCTNQ